MHVLLTGAFGYIGGHTLEELLRRGHQVRLRRVHSGRPGSRPARSSGEICATPTPSAGPSKESRPWATWASSSRSSRPPGSTAKTGRIARGRSTSEGRSACCRLCAPGRTRRASCSPLRCTSTAGRTTACRRCTPTTPVDPIEHYAKHKAACERMVRDSGLIWAIYRLPATLPLRLVLDAGMFEVPLDNRIEFGHVRDVGAALAKGLETEAIWGKLVLIGGGERCQYLYRELVAGVLEAAGVGMLPARAFTRTPFPTDWLDTRESQCLLQYQERTVEDYARALRAGRPGRQLRRRRLVRLRRGDAVARGHER